MRAALLLLLLWPALARADGGDYALDSQEWNGLADLASIAQGRGLTVEARRELRWTDIGKDDVLVILYPTARIEPVHLAAFLRGGGRALIADDFGRADDALARLGILRRAAERRGGVHVHDGNPNLPIAVSVSDHALSRGVAELTTNHPAAFSVPPGPDVVFSYGGRDEAVVVAGALGEGRFVALSDPSILINAMLAFDGNLAFAVNVLEFLADKRPARLLVISGEAEMAGEPAEVAPDRRDATVNELLDQLSRALDELNDYLAPETALRLLGWSGGLAALLAGAILLGRSRGRDPDAGFARVPTDAQGQDRLLVELDKELGDTSYAYAAALLREHAEAELEARLAGGARGQVERALSLIRRLPSRAQVVGQGVYVSRRAFVEAHGEVVAARKSG